MYVANTPRNFTDDNIPGIRVYMSRVGSLATSGHKSAVILHIGRHGDAQRGERECPSEQGHSAQHVCPYVRRVHYVASQLRTALC
jgi:hypothetical protein